MPMCAAPYEPYRKVGSTYFISGQLPTKADGTMPATIEEQTQAALENVERVVASCGGTRANVVKTTVMLRDFDEFAQMNEVYRAFFGTPYPARSAFGVSGLAAGARVEIEAIAVIE